MSERGRVISRISLVMLILASGLALLPFIESSAEPLNWRLYAAVYGPTLSTSEDKGLPGSAYLFVGVNFPPQATATVYVNGNPIGLITIDADGRATFLIQSRNTDRLERYFITLATDANTSATQDLRPEDDEPLWPPPPGYDGPVFFLDAPALTPTPVATATSTPTDAPPAATATAVPPTATAPAPAVAAQPDPTTAAPVAGDSGAGRAPAPARSLPTPALIGLGLLLVLVVAAGAILAARRR